LIAAGLLPTGTGAGKIIAAYPAIGGTADTCKYNFVNPADSDAAFRLQFFGGYTFSANGVKPNGTNAYAKTFINVSTNLSRNNTHLSKYIRENIRDGDRHDIGTLVGTASFYFTASYLSVGFEMISPKVQFK
jgi:hypothetical protein